MVRSLLKVRELDTYTRRDTVMRLLEIIGDDVTTHHGQSCTSPPPCPSVKAGHIERVPPQTDIASTVAVSKVLISESNEVDPESASDRDEFKVEPGPAQSQLDCPIEPATRVVEDVITEAPSFGPSVLTESHINDPDRDNNTGPDSQMFRGPDKLALVHSKTHVTSLYGRWKRLDPDEDMKSPNQSLLDNQGCRVRVRTATADNYSSDPEKNLKILDPFIQSPPTYGPALAQNDGSPGEMFSAGGEACAVQISSTRTPQMVGQFLSKRLDPDEFSSTPAPEITPVVKDLAIRLDPDKSLSCRTVFSSFALQRLGQVLTTRLDPDEHSKRPAPQMSTVLKDLSERLDPDERLLVKFRLYVPNLPDWYRSVLSVLVG